jgi:hypothetical protein
VKFFKLVEEKMTRKRKQYSSKDKRIAQKEMRLIDSTLSELRDS